MMKCTCLALFLCAIVWPDGAVFAGAWTQKEKGYYLKVGTNYLNSTGDIDAGGSRIQKAGMGELRDLNFSTYLEYGIRDRLTLVASTPYKRLSDNRTFANGIAKERRSGFGDVEVRMRWLMVDRGPTVASIAVGGKVPLWYGDDPNSRVPLSSKKVDVDVRFLMGRSLYPFPGYMTGEAGFRARGGVFSNEVFYTLEGGVTLDRFLFKGFVSGIRTFGPCEVVGEVGLIGDQNVTKLSPGVIYRLHDRAEVSLELIYIASGCNTTAGSTLSFGMAFKK